MIIKIKVMAARSVKLTARSKRNPVKNNDVKFKMSAKIIIVQENMPNHGAILFSFARVAIKIPKPAVPASPKKNVEPKEGLKVFDHAAFTNMGTRSQARKLSKTIDSINIILRLS